VTTTIRQAIRDNFLGKAPNWYKGTLVLLLLLNPILFYTAGPYLTGWILIGEFIFTLAMALKCYPLAPGGLLALEAVLLRMTTPANIYAEVANNLSVLLLLVFMVAGVYFMKELLQYVFTGILLGFRSKISLSLVFSVTTAFLSAFLDALTVIAVIISVAYGFYGVYHRYASGQQGKAALDSDNDAPIKEGHEDDLRNFCGVLRNLLMHAAVGTALGGVFTLVGEPQNLLIAQAVGWSFTEFFLRVAPVSVPVLFTGLATCLLLERFRLFGYGFQLPENVRKVLAEQQAEDKRNRTQQEKARLIIQAATGLVLILGLAFHLAEVGIIGLMIIILLTAMNGVIEEHRIGRAFEEALPFTALLAVFFAIVAVIHDQHLFAPVINFVLSLQGRTQLAGYYFANGLLSVVSDNVFVATVYITETARAFADGRISREQFDLLAVAINTGTNIPSIATPNGQAAFLFLLTSAVAPLIRLSYDEMVKLAMPYAVTMTGVGFLATWFLH
jgi:Na+:H+ antiporter, NhaB family